MRNYAKLVDNWVSQNHLPTMRNYAKLAKSSTNYEKLWLTCSQLWYKTVVSQKKISSTYYEKLCQTCKIIYLL